MIVASKPTRVNVTATLEDPQWDQFLERAGDNHHLQTARWAKLKSDSGWDVLRLILRNDDGILGGVQILYRSIPLVGRVGYAPRGPVISESNSTLYKQLFSELERVIRTEKFVCLMIQPPAGANQCVALLLARGFNPTPIQVAPTATLLIDLCQSPSEWLAAMRKSTRRSIRMSLSSGLNVRVGSEVDLPAFHSVLEQTGLRQGFTPQPLDYYRRLWQLFAPDGHIVIFIAELQGEVVAAELDIAFGDTLVSKRAGWSGRHRELHPNEGLIWAALNWAKNHGYKYYDLEGLTPEFARAIIRGDTSARDFGRTHDNFKLGFGGKVVVLPKNHEYVFGKLTGWAHRTLWLSFAETHWPYKLMRKLRLVSGEIIDLR